MALSRYDKYNPEVGGFRAPLAADFAFTNNVPDYAHANLEKMFAVGLNGSGQVVLNPAAADVDGVLILTKPKYAGEIVDVMTGGEIVEFTLQNGAAATAGTPYYSTGTAGDYTATAPAAGVNSVYLGTTVEATRLVVRVQKVQG